MKLRALETVNNQGLILVGEQINFSTFSHPVGPNKEQHACNIVRHPYATAQFFHFIIKTIMETLFGVTSNSSTISWKMGVMGKLSAYFRTVDLQGRGALHLHLLLYFCRFPSSQRMQTLLQQSIFCEKVVHFYKLPGQNKFIHVAINDVL